MSLADKIRAAGVVGAGGAGFPAHVKASSRAEIVIANGAECEPLLKVDQQIMAAQAAEVVEGLELFREAVGASRAVIALKRKYEDAVRALREEAARRRREIEFFLLGSFYPAGDEHVLVREVTGRVVPEGSLPLAVGAVVSNVGTLVNISRASRDLPVTTRTLTVAGEVKNSLTLEVPIGALVEDVLAAAGGPTIREYAVLDGGPVMGVFSDGAVAKTTTGLIVLPEGHKQVRYRRRLLETDVARAAQACDGCRFCTDYCPRYLLGHRIEPHRIMRLVGQQRYDAISRRDLEGAWFCCQCGLCGMFACPTTLSPDRVIAALLGSLRQAGEKKPPGNPVPAVHPFRDGRRVPVSRLARRIDVLRYDRPAPLAPEPLSVRRVRIKLKQHAGVPALPLVAAGDRVRAGQLIAEPPAGALGASIHASIDGVVGLVSPQAVFIRVEDGLR